MLDVMKNSIGRFYLRNSRTKNVVEDLSSYDTLDEAIMMGQKWLKENKPDPVVASLVSIGDNYIAVKQVA